MNHAISTAARRIAQAGIDFDPRHELRPLLQSVTPAPSEGDLVSKLHSALTMAEQVLARNPTGISQMKELHRLLFSSSSESLFKEIE